VLGVLGHGGFGITYRALDRQLGREVAIKEYLPAALAIRRDGTTVLPRSPHEADDFNWGRTRFVEEGRTLAGLQKSPAIVRVFDFLEFNGTAYIVMELVQGETLDHRLKRIGPLPPAAIERLLWPLLDGLACVHANGFLHRDIKPANILVDAEGDPTLIDFGASRAAMAGRSVALTAVFTLEYAAAEQVTSARQGPWTDIYALSATLYRTITGKAPPNVFDRMTEDRYEPLALLQPPGFSRRLLLGIDAGLAVKAGDRPQTIPGWRSVLGKTAAGDNDITVVSRHGRPSTMVAPEVEPMKRQARRGGLQRRLAAAAILVVVAGGFFAWKARDGDRVAAPERSTQVESPAVVPAVESAGRQRNAEPDERRAAESAEAGLRLSSPERQKVQIALTAAGFDTRGSDGTFGPRSREMIAAWQKAQGQPATGFLTGPQFQVLQRKADDERRKTEEEVRTRAAASAPATPAPAPAAAPFDGTYAGFFSPSGPVALQASPAHSISLRVANGSGSGTMTSASCGATPISVRISPSGAITGDAQSVDASCSRFPLAIQGQAANGQLWMTFSGALGSGSANLMPGAPPSPARRAAAPGSHAGRFDGSYAGSLSAVDTGGISRVLTADLEIAGDRLSGRIASPTCGSATIALAVSAGGEVSGEVRLQANLTCSLIPLGVQGRVVGDRLTLDLRGAGLRIQGTLTRRAG
jgi:serine/threonine protein kinase